MAINQDKVNEACTALEAEGKTPTLTAVREVLGEGSFSTLGRMVQVWKATKQQTVVSGVNATEAPESLLVAGGRMMTEVWAMAERMAGERLKAERQALEVEKAQMAEELAAAYAELEEAREELKTKTRDAKEWRHAAEIRRHEINRLAEELTKQISTTREAQAEAGAYKLAIEALRPTEAVEAGKTAKTAPKSRKPSRTPKSDGTDTQTQPLGI